MRAMPCSPHQPERQWLHLKAMDPAAAGPPKHSMRIHLAEVRLGSRVHEWRALQVVVTGAFVSCHLVADALCQIRFEVLTTLKMLKRQQCGV